MKETVDTGHCYRSTLQTGCPLYSKYMTVLKSMAKKQFKLKIYWILKLQQKSHYIHPDNLVKKLRK